MLAIMYKWIRVEDLPYKFDELIRKDDVPKVLDYNLNDTLITLLSYVVRRKDLQLRQGMIKKYNHGFKILSYNKSNLATLFIATDYANITKEPIHKFKYLRTDRNFIHLKECISKKIHFEDLIKVDIDEMVAPAPGKSKVPVSLIKGVYLSQFLNYLRQVTVYGTTDIDYVIHFGHISFNFKSGGLHSIDTPRIFRTIEGEVYYNTARS